MPSYNIAVLEDSLIAVLEGASAAPDVNRLTTAALKYSKQAEDYARLHERLTLAAVRADAANQKAEAAKLLNEALWRGRVAVQSLHLAKIADAMASNAAAQKQLASVLARLPATSTHAAKVKDALAHLKAGEKTGKEQYEEQRRKWKEERGKELFAYHLAAFGELSARGLANSDVGAGHALKALQYAVLPGVELEDNAGLLAGQLHGAWTVAGGGGLAGADATGNAKATYVRSGLVCWDFPAGKPRNKCLAIEKATSLLTLLARVKERQEHPDTRNPYKKKSCGIIDVGCNVSKAIGYVADGVTDLAEGVWDELQDLACEAVSSDLVRNAVAAGVGVTTTAVMEAGATVAAPGAGTAAAAPMSYAAGVAAAAASEKLLSEMKGGVCPSPSKVKAVTKKLKAANVVLYQNWNFKGKWQALGPGFYDVDDLFKNNSVSSLTVPAGLSVRFYRYQDFWGKNWTVTGPKQIAKLKGWKDDMASSCVVFPSSQSLDGIEGQEVETTVLKAEAARTSSANVRSRTVQDAEQAVTDTVGRMQRYAAVLEKNPRKAVQMAHAGKTVVEQGGVGKWWPVGVAAAGLVTLAVAWRRKRS